MVWFSEHPIIVTSLQTQNLFIGPCLSIRYGHPSGKYVLRKLPVSPDGTRLNTNQQCALTAGKPNGILAKINKALTAG